ncbi:MAG: putative lipid II flippase FtsW [Clostridiales bacterium]|jgi:cell division protein FtsW|nr:putative lipid II flippase FtsW [Clostridiales bacterium]
MINSIETPKKHIRFFPGDPIVIVTVMLLVFIGIVMVFSSSYYVLLSENQSPFSLLRKQAIAAAVGLVGMFVAARLPYYKVYNMKTSVLAYFVACTLVVIASFIPGSHGANRWIPLFGGFSIQPSEVAKIAMVLICSCYLAADDRRAYVFSKGFFGWAIILIIPFMLIWQMTNNFSSALTVAIIAFAIFFVATPHWKMISAMGLFGGAAMFLYLMIGGDWRGGRIAAWLDPWADPGGDGFQIIQSLYSVSSGGLFGLGLGNSRQKLKYMPEPQNDCIFAVICEETGFVGAAIVLTLFAILIWRGVIIAMNASDKKGCYIASGITAMIAAQVIINVAVVTNTIPVTGIPMPFISYGGTSLSFTMILIGILLNVSSFAKNEKGGI